MEFISNNDNEDSGTVTSDGSLENIWVAASDGNMQQVKALIDNGINAVNEQDINGYSAIHAAASYGHEELIKYLISIGANVNLRDNDGDTPILICEEPEIFLLLKSYGADTTTVNNMGEKKKKKMVEDENDMMIRFLVTQGLVSAERAEAALAKINDNIIDEEDDDNEIEDDMIIE